MYFVPKLLESLLRPICYNSVIMKNIVTIGGGTGSYTVLSGIKNIPGISISAIVAMTDDGGSTGVLRDELGVLPPGDVRQCLVALSEQSEIVRKLMTYRFSTGGLKGHNFGNIFLAGLEKVTGSFVDGVEIASDILKVKGKVIPVTDRVATLNATLADGTVLNGENEINHHDVDVNTIKKLKTSTSARINPHAKKAILEANFIFIGPGNHYCSIIPNLIVPGVSVALKQTKAKIIYIVNLTNKKGHTLGWQTGDYLKNLEKYMGRKCDFILINNQKPNKEQLQVYEKQEGGSVMVKNDLIKDRRVIEVPLISKKIVRFDKSDIIAKTRSLIRHDSALIQKTLAKIIHHEINF